MLGWLVVERFRSGHATTLGAASGAVAGLVAITPCAGFVGAMTRSTSASIAGAVCMLAVSLKFKFGYDDSLDVVGVHLVGGLIGSLLARVSSPTTAINSAGHADGVFYGGGWGLFGDQVLAVGVGDGVLLRGHRASSCWCSRRCCPEGIRVDAEEEESGLDLNAALRDRLRLDRV